MMLWLRQCAAIAIAVLGLIARFGVQRTSGLIVAFYRCSDRGVALVIEQLMGDEENKL